MAFDATTRERLAAESQQIIARYPQPRSALLPMLHLMQGEEGYVSPDGITLCAELLDLTAAEVSAVATFYTQYKRHPNGEYTVGVCTNTLCAVMGGDAIYDDLTEYLGVGHDETTPDGVITLERIECNAACDYAPVVMVNWEFFDNQTPSSARDLTDRLRAGEDVAPTRGASKVCSFKHVSRVLAGFPDGRADEGVGAGPASLEGLRLAHENGWTAPGADDDSKDRDSKDGDSKRDGGRSPSAERSPRGQDAAPVTGQEQDRRNVSSHDAPAVAPGESERAGTVAGKPSADATDGPGGKGTGTEPTPSSADTESSGEARESTRPNGKGN